VSYLGTRLSGDKIRPLPIKLNLDVRTLHDVQKLVETLQWVRPIIGIPPALMIPFYELLKGSHPWVP
ncbi:POK18 protein, partial [Nothoprocta ornata]|nr:POK18 protein [Nothoprocta ornata]